jgi:hypothetical protein
MAIPPQFQKTQAPPRRSQVQGKDQSGGNLAADVSSLRNAIQRFVDAHGDDRRVSGAIKSLQSASAELKRAGGDGRDAGPPSPGRQAAMNAMSAKGPPSQ